MGKILRSERLEEIVVRLERLEQRPTAPVRCFTGKAKKKKSIWVAGDRLRFGNRLQTQTQTVLNYIKKSIRAGRFMSPFESGLYPARLKTRSEARELKVKNNIIAFYPQYGVLAKLTRHDGKRSVADLQNEHFVLSKLWKKVPGIAPRPLAFDPYMKALWMEFIQEAPGANPANEEAALIFLNKLFHVYEKLGFVTARLGDVESVDVDQLAVKQFLERARISGEVLRSLMAIAGKLSVIKSFIHGDALNENLLFGAEADGRRKVVMSDWELSRIGAVEVDVNSLYMQRRQPEILAAYDAWARSHGRSLNVRATAAACGIMRNLRWLSKFECFEAARGESRAANHYLACSLRDLREQIRTLETAVS